MRLALIPGPCLHFFQCGLVVCLEEIHVPYSLTTIINALSDLPEEEVQQYWF